MPDFNLANQAGAALRAELNTILGALVSLSRGGSAPTTTFAGQLWVDSSGGNDILKIRNAGDSGWVTIGTLGSGGWEAEGTTAASRAVLAAVSNAAMRAALGLTDAIVTSGFATQAEAEAGTNTSKIMNPLRTAQAIAELAGSLTPTFSEMTSQTVRGAGTYENTSGKVMFVTVTVRCDSNGFLSIQRRAPGDSFTTLVNQSTVGSNRLISMSFPLPPGWFYSFSASGDDSYARGWEFV